VLVLVLVVVHVLVIDPRASRTAAVSGTCPTDEQEHDDEHEHEHEQEHEDLCSSSRCADRD